MGVEHLVNDVGVLRRHGLADLGAGVLGAHQAADLNEPVEGDAVPLPHVLRLPLHLLQLLPWVVNEGGQLVPLVFGQGCGKQVVHLLPHHAGGRVEQVEKGLILPVDVRDKVLGPLGQVQDGLEIDDLTAGGLDCGILAGEHLEIAQAGGRSSCFLFHESPPSNKQAAIRRSAVCGRPGLTVHREFIRYIVAWKWKMKSVFCVNLRKNTGKISCQPSRRRRLRQPARIDRSRFHW